jgi:CubicO group peptidase (beta-lactamase class C family)
MPPFWNRSRPAAPPPPGIRLEPQRSRQIDGYLAQQIPPDSPGLALGIVKDSALVHAVGYGLASIQSGRPIAPDTIFHLASCGKQFTALGIVMLVEAGKLHPDDPLGKHIPELAGFGCTLRQLLHHTAGIRDLYDEAGIDQVLARSARPANADMVRLYAELGCPLAARPGSTFSYSNSGYDLLGTVIERVSGQSYHDFFQARVFDPLGMRDTFSAPETRASDPRRATGYDVGESEELVANAGSEFDGLVGSGSFCTTVPDLARYEQALRQYRLISEAGTLAMFNGVPTGEGDVRYGLGWFIGSYNGAALADHEGAWNGFRSYLCCFLDVRFSLFVLTNHPDVDLMEIANVVSEAFGGEVA